MPNKNRIKLVVTGGCGFIGSTLIKKLYKEGSYSIRIIDNLSTGSLNQLEASGISVQHSEC